ncbi:hypothetical protein MCOR25_006868 [Pyricularia grisea]|nr:hypothetical protein MCOR25_006868 [Pyricularia grisea]
MSSKVRENSAQPRMDSKGDMNKITYVAPSMVERLVYCWYMWVMKGFSAPFIWYRDWMEWYYPPDGRPEIVKAYECRPHLPVRIFFPASYDRSSQTKLPALVAIHGGGFCFGTARDADEWARAFADQHSTLIVCPSYSKAPWSPFPAALNDIEAIYKAIVGDESLPISKSQVAIAGWSAGGNLAMAVSQMPSIRALSPGAPSAGITIYGAMDMSVSAADKAKTRWYKTRLQPPRGQAEDGLFKLAPLCDWGYIPFGTDLRHPLLSPGFADERNLPPYVCVVAAELDMLAHESWRFAVRLDNERFPERHRDMPDPNSNDPELAVAGRKAPSRRRGRLEEEDGGDDRFGWEDNGDGFGVKWMLVPDALHGFDCASIRLMTGGWDAVKDAEMKTKVEIERLGRWLRTKVWKIDEEKKSAESD